MSRKIENLSESIFLLGNSLPWLLTLLLASYSLYTFAAEVDYSGHYRVRGECASRTADGSYKSCIAWDKLNLKRLRNSDEYSFSLETHTFASTPGGCQLSGSFKKELRNGSTWMTRSDEVKDKCHLALRFTETKIHLEVPESEVRASCQDTCFGVNASFGSGPFPLKSSRSQKSVVRNQ